MNQPANKMVSTGANPSTSQSLPALVGRDFVSALRQNKLLLIFIIGVILICSGELFLCSTEESPRAAAAIAVEEARQSEIKSAPANHPAPAPPESWSCLSMRSQLVFWRFVADLAVKFGEVLVIGGVVEYLLHSRHYSEFYLGLVEDVMFGERFIKRFENSPDFLKRVSDVYFRHKFPNIQGRLSETLNAYFPTTHTFYLNDYVVSYNISSVGGDYIKMIQENRYHLIPATAAEQVPLKFEVKMVKPGGDNDLTAGTVIGFRVGPHDFTAKAAFREGVAEDGVKYLQSKLDETISGQSDYAVSIKVEVIYNVVFDPREAFSVISLVNDLTVSAECADGLSMFWLDVGVKDAFYDLFPGYTGDKKISKKYDGLVFQKQGYTILFRKVTNHVHA